MCELITLKEKLQEIEAITDEMWLKNLNDRKKEELHFHDLDRDTSRIEQLDADTYKKRYGNRKYYMGAVLSRTYMSEWVTKHAKNKVFLDYACGNGGNAINAAKAGATLSIGIDISRTSVENAKIAAKKAGVQNNTYFVQADAENTLLPNNSIDTIICSGVLHHLDLSCAFPELHRILKVGGKVLAAEALAYNPAIKLYRYLTHEMRTDWEKSHILSLADVRYAERYFKIGEIRYWHITSILTPYVSSLLPVFNVIDNILTKIPLIKLMSWSFTFELIKQDR